MKGTYPSHGATLAYDDSGSGLPLVFLHPTPLDRHFWPPLIQQLSGVRAIVPDLRGHGASELGAGLPVGDFERVPDAQVLSMTQLADDILALMDHLALPGAVFAGCSIGGYVLLELWRRAPARMRGLAFICSKPQPDTEANRIKRSATILQARAGASAALFSGMAQTLIGVTARQLHPEMVTQLQAHMTLSPDALVAVQAGLATRPDSSPTVATINVPVLAVPGGEDPVITPAEMEVFRAAPGGCDFHLLPDAGHFAAYEQPRHVAQILSAWLDRLRG